ncbi:peptidoglycan-binding protein [Corallococcus sp. AS-1-6]|uniref:peptidoglycan-binding protein n=1 Tax=Corallococcus sp. AS-1-6 TaxID=2874599 RepID=UPI001CC00DB0|nr:peptidoglycan-binding protein [Corallococcus sp. AS-1-6]
MGQPTGSFGASEDLLQLGSTGSAVADLQNHLRLAGLYRRPIDGCFGADTDYAVRQFQFARKLSADGVVGPATWAALKSRTVPASAVGGANSPKGFPFEMGRGVYSFGRVSNGDGVNLRAQPHLSGTFKKKLPFNTHVFVSRELSGDWYFVTLTDGNSGFVYKKYISITPSDPGAVLHRIKKNEGALAIVKQHYKGSAIKWGQDERYYANVLVEANRGSGLRGIYKPTEDATWDKTQTREDYLIWIPSVAFAKTLRGKVGSGSITYDLWQEAKALATNVGNAYLGNLAFSAGLIHGALESVWDLLTGLIDLLELAWKLIYSVLSGEILSDLKGLWDLAASLDLKTLTEAGIKALASRWNAPNLLHREHFRGWLIGYVIVEIVMAVASGGATIVKWAGKAGKLGKLLAKFPRLVKVAEKAKGLTKPLEEAIQKAKKSGVRSAVKAQGKARGFWSRLQPAKLAQARTRRALLRKKLKDTRVQLKHARTQEHLARKQARISKLTQANPVDMRRVSRLRKFPRLMSKRLKHIIHGDSTGGGHGPLSPQSGKSKFNASVDIPEIITDAARTGTIGPNYKRGTQVRLDGSFRVEKTYPHPVGFTPKGQPVHSIRVAIDDDGAIITAFPVPP